MLRILIATIVLVLSSSLAHAATCTAHVGDLDFGAVDAIGNTAAITTADVNINCGGVTNGVTEITVCANLGAGSGGETGGVRQSIAGGGSLGFALYASSGTGSPWGSASAPDLGDPVKITVPVTGNTASRTA